MITRSQIPEFPFNTHLNSDDVSTNSLTSPRVQAVSLPFCLDRQVQSVLPASLYCLYSTSVLSDPNLNQGGILKEPPAKRLVLQYNVEWKIWEQTSLCFFLVWLRAHCFIILSMILAIAPWVSTLCEICWSISPICVDRFRGWYRKRQQSKQNGKENPSHLPRNSNLTTPSQIWTDNH